MMQVVVSSGAIGSGDGLLVLPSCSSSTALVSRSSDHFKRFLPFPDSKFLFSSAIFKGCPSCMTKLGLKMDKSEARGLTVRASRNSNENSTPVAPLQFESPTGQLLAQILQTHPHLLPAAVDQQLENLHVDRDTQTKEAPAAAQNLLLYRRIAEVREKERQKALEEIIYCLIVQKFKDKDISMTPPISMSSDFTDMVDSWTYQEQKLESVHSPEALEMVQSHLSLVLGERMGPLDTILQISKLKLGKLYAASIMYGYFLRRVDQRFQLERTMNLLPKNGNKEEKEEEDDDEEEYPVMYREPQPKYPLWDPDSLIRILPDNEDVSGSGGPKPHRLRSYVMYLDAETLQRYATIRSKEAVSLIEKQTQALFGRPDIRISEDGSLNTSNDEMIGITFSGLTLLVLEAVAFGSFLWDAEGYVESKYHFVTS